MRTLVATLAVVVALLFSAGSAWASENSLAEGFTAFRSGDYATAFRIWLLFAEQGDAGMQYLIGTMYDLGQGVSEDDAEAAKWARKAAEQGHAPAQHRLGVYYYQGVGVPQDYTEAAKWWRKAAKPRAWNQGNAKAQLRLGGMYSLGKGVPEDYVKAHMWFSIASAQGNEDAARLLDRVKTLMTPADISKAQELATEWTASKSTTSSDKTVYCKRSNGTVYSYTNVSGDQCAKNKKIAKAEYDSLKNKKTDTASTTKPDTASSVDDPLEAKLEKLQKLLDKGLITEEEAAAKRAKILEDL